MIMMPIGMSHAPGVLGGVEHLVPRMAHNERGHSRFQPIRGRLKGVKYLGLQDQIRNDEPDDQGHQHHRRL